MIGRIRGKIIEKQPPLLLVDVSGVGYELQLSMNTFYHLPETGQETTLHTHFVVREDAQLLYGFHSLQERKLFRSLIKVNGVGPKLAITILSSIDPDAFVRCVSEQDSASLVRLPGIGKKTAERLIVEMRDRLSDWHDTSVDSNTIAPMLMERVDSGKQDAISALIALGYKQTEASKAVSKVYQPQISSEELIRMALQGTA